MKIEIINDKKKRDIMNEISRYFEAQVDCMQKVNACSMNLLCRELEGESLNVLLDLLTDNIPRDNELYTLATTIRMLNEGMI